jgi:hypothetical protein
VATHVESAVAKRELKKSSPIGQEQLGVLDPSILPIRRIHVADSAQCQALHRQQEPKGRSQMRVFHGVPSSVESGGMMGRQAATLHEAWPKDRQRFAKGWA